MKFADFQEGKRKCHFVQIKSMQIPKLNSENNKNNESDYKEQLIIIKTEKNSKNKKEKKLDRKLIEKMMTTMTCN